MRVLRSMVVLSIACLVPGYVRAGGGFLGIDHRVAYDNSGVWNRNIQSGLLYGSIAGVGLGALAFGDQDKFGDTLWRSVDAMVFTGVTTEAMKYTFQRERPSQTSDPNRFFQGSHAQSFPSGEVAAISAAVTPFLAEYGSDHPVVYALALLPAYDAVARVKTRGHWQSDVLVGAGVGVGFGIYASKRNSPLIISWLPGGFKIGFVHHFK
ncbi:phosphatase PAP2 family protein [Dyella acidisoli]|nr:phosphatase PAP2 family protein [Dyella acidisoli]